MCSGVRGRYQGYCPGEPLLSLSWGSDIGWVKDEACFPQNQVYVCISALGKHQGLSFWVPDVRVDKQPEKSIQPRVR